MAKWDSSETTWQSDQTGDANGESQWNGRHEWNQRQQQRTQGQAESTAEPKSRPRSRTGERGGGKDNDDKDRKGGKVKVAWQPTPKHRCARPPAEPPPAKIAKIVAGKHLRAHLPAQSAAETESQVIITTKNKSDAEIGSKAAKEAIGRVQAERRARKKAAAAAVAAAVAAKQAENRKMREKQAEEERRENKQAEEKQAEEETKKKTQPAAPPRQWWAPVLADLAPPWPKEERDRPASPSAARSASAAAAEDVEQEQEIRDAMRQQLHEFREKAMNDELKCAPAPKAAPPMMSTPVMNELRLGNHLQGLVLEELKVLNMRVLNGVNLLTKIHQPAPDSDMD